MRARIDLNLDINNNIIIDNINNDDNDNNNNNFGFIIYISLFDIE